ncbi:MAG TPA: YigZ family protein [Defluviitoga sp.]|nr:YigZ family protein [Defluviitoga sp.]HOP24898.1 YigZ family protein [Defluviitoga sp.]HPZ28793.1 YigZ family protein [Defluviitoga sp.]HQD62864.1 YigZ family protein [Defluviitoga sp.]
MKYRSIKESQETSINIERSIFIANAQKVNTLEEAQNFIKVITQKYNNATHNCWAYKILDGDQELFHYSDNGEPSGTAGKPIYGTIEKFDLSNVAIVVTRYFGGVKLGIRGLIDAYSTCAEELIKNSKLAEYETTYIYAVRCDYSDYSQILRLISKEPGIYFLDQKFTEDVFLKTEIIESYKEKILPIIESKLQEISFVRTSEREL